MSITVSCGKDNDVKDIHNTSNDNLSSLISDLQSQVSALQSQINQNISSTFSSNTENLDEFNFDTLELDTWIVDSALLKEYNISWASRESGYMFFCEGIITNLKVESMKDRWKDWEITINEQYSNGYKGIISKSDDMNVKINFYSKYLFTVSNTINGETCYFLKQDLIDAGLIK